MVITLNNTVILREYFLETLAQLRQVYVTGATFTAVSEAKQIGILLLRELWTTGHECLEDLLQTNINDVRTN